MTVHVEYYIYTNVPLMGLRVAQDMFILNFYIFIKMS
jgi:hypothetical protein